MQARNNKMGISDLFFRSFAVTAYSDFSIIFRAENIKEAYQYIIYMFTKWQPSSLEYGVKCIQYIAILIIIEWINRRKMHGLEINIKYPIIRWGIYCAIFYYIFYYSNEIQTFIYFQF